MLKRKRHNKDDSDDTTEQNDYRPSANPNLIESFGGKTYHPIQSFGSEDASSFTGSFSGTPHGLGLSGRLSSFNDSSMIHEF